MNVQKLFLFHAIITLAAAIVLVASPTLIPRTVNIDIQKEQYLLCYFLAAAELAIAYLSFYSRKITDPFAIRIITITMIIFHTATALLELLAFSNGLSPKIIANVLARIIIVILFYYYGLKKAK